MTKHNVMRPLARANAFVAAAVIAASALLPAMLLSNSASGAQLTDRYIDLSSTQSSGGNSTEGSGRDGGDTFGQDVTYTVGFTFASTTAVEGLVIDFCEDSPIVGDACTAPTGFNTNYGAGLALANQNGTVTDWQLDAASTASKLVLTRTGGAAAVTATATELDLGTTAAADGITNPTDLDSGTPGTQTTGTFYARILTFPTAAGAQNYTSVDPTDGGNTPYTDDGGIAMAITNQLTITARVQEVLEFCIGTDDDSITAGLSGGPGARATGDNCTDVDGTDIDLGVVDSNSVQRTSDADIGNSGNDGVMMIRTNALNGAVVYYKAEQESGITNQPGALRQAGVDDCTVALGVNNACFNSAGGGGANPTQATLTQGTELFGMTLHSLDTSAGGATTALSCDANYRGDSATTDDCTGAAASAYAWDPTGSFDVIASSGGPIDDEMANIGFAATASPTTPTGLYTVTANFVATSTF